MLSVAYFAYAFQLGSGEPARSGLGDWVDSYFINYLLEHWRYSLLHFTSPASPLMFYPDTGTLGYSHGLVLYAPFYVPARLFFDPFVAETAAIFAVMVLGAISLYAMLRQFIGTTFVESVTLTALFSSSGNVINDMMSAWAQRGSVFLIPPIAWLALVAWARPPGAVKNGMAGLAGLLALLLFTQDFHTAIFGALIVTLAAIAWPEVTWAGLTAIVASGRRAWTETAWLRQPPRPVHRAWIFVAMAASGLGLLIWMHPLGEVRLGPLKISAENHRRPFAIAATAVAWILARQLRPLAQLRRLTATARSLPAAVAALAGAVAGAAVFLWIYLPTYLQHQRFPDEVLFESLDPIAPATWISLPALLLDLNAYRSPVSVLLAVAAVILLRHEDAEKSAARTGWFLVGLTALVLILPISAGHFSFWKVTLGWMPGFTAIRDPKRIIYIYELAMAIGLACCLVRLPPRSVPRLGILLTTVVLLGLFWNRDVLQYRRPIERFQKFVQSPIAIDPSCRSFYITKASAEYMSRSFHQAMLYGGDSMFIALRHSIPTLNGYSAWLPGNWNLDNPQDPGYTEALVRWVTRHQLPAVCELDIEARTMRPSPVLR